MTQADAGDEFERRIFANKECEKLEQLIAFLEKKLKRLEQLKIMDNKISIIEKQLESFAKHSDQRLFEIEMLYPKTATSSSLVAPTAPRMTSLPAFGGEEEISDSSSLKAEVPDLQKRAEEPNSAPISEEFSTRPNDEQTNVHEAEVQNMAKLFATVHWPTLAPFANSTSNEALDTHFFPTLHI
ncbi:unnamed protein product [Caenorhabditis auriculariae]|uniref:Uncharacterized protein n=1 Tax=Caenorhabditis auriculariae TaxID=2777116 RepID=A0A8S1HZA9_9PELO|nr:unnamed protein product [Caenorhabditis auriculariae]